MRTTIWFDAATPPQALWFSGLVEPLQEAGFELLVTCRSLSGTDALAKRFLPQVDAVIEGHEPGSKVSKLLAIVQRAADLRKWIKTAADPKHIVAVSHNSYAHILAARSLRIPVLTSMDYEGQPANHLAFRLAHRILLPEAYPQDVARRQGARPHKVVRYPGVKESIYLSVMPLDDPEVERRWQHIRKPLAVVRPEARFATYHQHANPLVGRVIEHLVEQGAHVVAVPRNAEQGRWLHAAFGPRIEILESPVNGPSLLRRADIFVGAGGSMTREAAVVGTPSYSIFCGAPAAVDEYLIERGRIWMVVSSGDIGAIQLRPKLQNRCPPIDGRSRRVIADSVASLGARDGVL